MAGGADGGDRAQRIQEVVDGCISRRVSGESLPDGVVVGEHPELMPELAAALGRLAIIEQAEDRARSAAGGLGRVPAAGVETLPGYELVGEIHRGGQGIVYQAVQERTRRSVAIKVLAGDAGPGTESTRRFEREIEILGRLRHPNVPAIHDAGCTGDSFYYVTDYISGEPLDEYVAARGRCPRETLGLFVKICDAISAAHLRGIIHRDLKPGNVLIDGDGEPHVLDFGLAKVVGGERAMTTTGEFVGSMPWASPEQIEGSPADIDVRTDVYALGVMLYQALTGRFPYAVTGSVREVVDNILSAEPARLRELGRGMDADVETIVLKCLAKAPERRYQTAGELAGDLRHYLAGEPIGARRDSLGYVLRAELRRHRPAVVVAVAFVLVVCAGLVTSLAFWRRAVRERDAAEAARCLALREAENATAANDFLREVLTLASPWRALGRELTVRDALDIAAGKIDGFTAGRPETEAAVREIVGRIYHSLGEFEVAVRQLEAATEIRQRTQGAEHPATLRLAAVLAGALGDFGRMEEAIARLGPTVEAQRRVLGEMHPDTVRSSHRLAWFLFTGGRAAEAEPLFRRSREGFRLNDGPDAASTLLEASNLAAALIAQGKLDEAEPLAVDGRDGLVRTLDARHPHTLYARNIHAWYLYTGGRFAEATPLYRGIVEDATGVLGPEHPYRLYWMGNLGWCLLKHGQLEEAEGVFAEVLAAERRVLTEGHAYIIESSQGYAETLLALGRFEEAEEVAREAYDGARARYGAGDRITLEAAAGLAAVYEAWGRRGPAAEWRARAAVAGNDESVTGAVRKP